MQRELWLQKLRQRAKEDSNTSIYHVSVNGLYHSGFQIDCTQCRKVKESSGVRHRRSGRRGGLIRSERLFGENALRCPCGRFIGANRSDGLCGECREAERRRKQQQKTKEFSEARYDPTKR